MAKGYRYDPMNFEKYTTFYISADKSITNIINQWVGFVQSTMICDISNVGFNFKTQMWSISTSYQKYNEDIVLKYVGKLFKMIRERG